jgi:hypothetical protein
MSRSERNQLLFLVVAVVVLGGGAALASPKKNGTLAPGQAKRKADAQAEDAKP